MAAARPVSCCIPFGIKNFSRRIFGRLCKKCSKVFHKKDSLSKRDHVRDKLEIPSKEHLVLSDVMKPGIDEEVKPPDETRSPDRRSQTSMAHEAEVQQERPSKSGELRRVEMSHSDIQTVSSADIHQPSDNIITSYHEGIQPPDENMVKLCLQVIKILCFAYREPQCRVDKEPPCYSDTEPSYHPDKEQSYHPDKEPPYKEDAKSIHQPSDNITPSYLEEIQPPFENTIALCLQVIRILCFAYRDPPCNAVTEPPFQNHHVKTPHCKTETSKNILTEEEKVILRSKGRDGYLDDEIIRKAQELLKGQFNSFDGLQPSAVLLFPDFCVQGEAVQIHYEAEREHWVTSCYKEGHIMLADSMKPKRISATICQQISNLYGQVVKRPLNKLKLLDVDQQNNGYDCGVFAVANAYEFLAGNGNVMKRYQHDKMREHLLLCFEKGEISVFPSKV